jgi:hypothetical protein
MIAPFPENLKIDFRRPGLQLQGSDPLTVGNTPGRVFPISG